MAVKKLIKFLASLKLAVVIMISLAVLTAIGTIVESKYDAVAASKLVYHTPWMYIVLSALSTSLIAVMVDRWPWQKKHIPFILAHIGLLVIMFGFVINATGLRFLSWQIISPGIDGSMRIGINEKNRFVALPQTDFQVWSSFDGDRYTKIFEKEVDFFKDRPEKKSVSLNLPEGELKVVEYLPYAIAAKTVVPLNDAKAGAALRFLMKNERVQVSEWLVQPSAKKIVNYEFGPASLMMGPKPASLPNANLILLEPQEFKSGKAPTLRYTIYYKDKSRKPQNGFAKEGDVIQTGWMGLEFHVQRYMPMAEEKWEFKKMEKPTPLTTQAIKISFMNKEHWMQANDVAKFFTEKAVYIVTYASRRFDIGFDVFLKKFEVGRYQGTMRAASYESLVEVPGLGEKLISMNEPLKHQGLTLYQASFQEGPTGDPIATVLSVNYDPGRFFKYAGSLILTLGIAWLFYHRRRITRATAPKAGEL